MKREPIESSCIAATGYDPETQSLEIELRHGGVYRYRGVPAKLATEFSEAESAGAFWVARIKTAFPFDVIKPPPAKPKGFVTQGMR